MTSWKHCSRTAGMAMACLLVATSALSRQAHASDSASAPHALAPARHVQALDLDDPAQQRSYRELLQRAGIKQDSPLYQWKGDHRPPSASGGSGQVFTLLGFGSDDAGANVSSGALYVGSADIKRITLTLLVTDPDGSVVTSGTADVTDRSSAVVNATMGKNPDRKPLNATATASVLYKDGSHDVYYVSGDAASFPSKVENHAPALNDAAPGNKDVQVCINRATAEGAPAPACNFVLASVDPAPSLQLPVIGSAVFDGNIDVDGAGKPVNASATVLMLAPEGAGPCPFATLGDAFFSDPGTKVTGKTLSWSIDPLRFDQGCAIAAGPYSFTLAVSVSIQGKPAWAVVSSATDSQTTTTRQIPAVEVVAGCVAKGTKVTLGSGATRLVEQLKVGDKLKSQDGNLAIAAIASGTREESVTFTLASGQSVQVSTIHAVPTQRGIIQAQDLRLGDELTTSSGTSRVTRIVSQLLPQPLQVYDLVLTPAKVSSTQGLTYYADGVLVGDGAMKASLAKAKAQAKEQAHE